MRLAQQLYEGIEVKGRGLTGLISYLRTDSTRIAEEMQQAAKAYISSQYGDPYTRTGSVKTKKQTVRIQDAHEAIRPTDVTLDPKMLEESLSRDQYRLYKLIYERFLASQMADAVYKTQHVTIGAGDYTFDASGSRLGFAGFMKVYKEEDEQETDEDATIAAYTHPLFNKKGKFVGVISIWLSLQQIYATKPVTMGERAIRACAVILLGIWALKTRI